MKKLKSLIFAFVLCFATLILVACGSNAEQTAQIDKRVSLDTSGDYQVCEKVIVNKESGEEVQEADGENTKVVVKSLDTLIQANTTNQSNQQDQSQTARQKYQISISMEYLFQMEANIFVDETNQQMAYKFFVKAPKNSDLTSNQSADEIEYEEQTVIFYIKDNKVYASKFEELTNVYFDINNEFMQMLWNQGNISMADFSSVIEFLDNNVAQDNLVVKLYENGTTKKYQVIQEDDNSKTEIYIIFEDGLVNGYCMNTYMKDSETKEEVKVLGIAYTLFDGQIEFPNNLDSYTKIDTPSTNDDSNDEGGDNNTDNTDNTDNNDDTDNNDSNDDTDDNNKDENNE